MEFERRRMTMKWIPPDLEEVSLIINNLKNRKVLGSDGIPVEFLMIGGSTLAEVLTHLIMKKCQTVGRNLVSISLFKKKGACTNYNNYQGICLLTKYFPLFYLTKQWNLWNLDWAIIRRASEGIDQPLIRFPP